jgi:SNF2 family DNA or RNA helicase
VFVHNLTAAGSVEEKMLALQDRKRQLAQSLFGGSQGSTLLNLAAIVDLFAPLDSPAA